MEFECIKMGIDVSHKRSRFRKESLFLIIRVPLEPLAVSLLPRPWVSRDVTFHQLLCIITGFASSLLPPLPPPPLNIHLPEEITSDTEKEDSNAHTQDMSRCGEHVSQCVWGDRRVYLSIHSTRICECHLCATLDPGYNGEPIRHRLCTHWAYVLVGKTDMNNHTIDM